MPGAHRPREFMEEELLDANPARGFIVKPGDPRLQPLRPARRRRAVPPAEIHKFMRVVRPRSVAACWAPLLTGARPGELFATRRDDIDRDLELIYLHQTAHRFGRISPGTKTTHHLAEKAERGRWTLFPRPLIDLCDEGPAALSGLLFPSPRSKVWAHRNFYRNVWEPARRESGTNFTLYDLRHTFASRLSAAGIPLTEVAAWMGHSLRAGGAPVNSRAQPSVRHRSSARAWLAPARQGAATGGCRASSTGCPRSNSKAQRPDCSHTRPDGRPRGGHRRLSVRVSSTAERCEPDAQVAHGEPVQVPRATTRNSLGLGSQEPGELPLEAQPGILLDDALPDCVGYLVTA
jgi:hypothetical protein